jgi:DNA-binding response OmpR family regulator
VAAVPLFLGEDEPAGTPERRDPPRLSVVPGGRAGKGAGGEPSVLLVEDDPAMRLLCTFNLEAAGFRVVAASTGREGLERARAQRFDLLLLDVMLPDLGGFEIAAELRGDAPVVFLSARTSAADLARGRAVGAIDYVTKPFDPVQLATRLREDLDELGRGGADHVWELRFGPPAEK